jgi:squalene synthase HpnD
MTTVVWQRVQTAPEPRPIDTAAADAAANARLVRATGGLFFWTMRLLPAPRRRAMYALYGFWHAIDSVTDDTPTPAQRDQERADWRYEIGQLFDGRPQQPATRALAGAVRYCGLRRNDFMAVIDGKTVDCGTAIKAPSLVELDVHCAQMAVAVGLLAVRILGVTTPVGDRAATELGRALRLTSILNDLAADAARQRLYLPRDLLRACGIFETDPQTVLSDPALPEVCDAIARRADRHFADAAALIATLPRRNLRAVAVMLACYRAQLHKLMARGWQRLDHKVRVPVWRQVAITLRYGLFGR